MRHLFFLLLCACMFGESGGQLASAGDRSCGPLRFESWFAGRSIANGMFHSTLLGPDRTIKATFSGRRQGRFFKLDEHIAYSDGEVAHKVWQLEKTGPGSYIGRRDDLVGDADGFTDPEGRIHLRYTALTNGWKLGFDDVLALNCDNTVTNTTSVSYLFLHVGDVELHFRHQH